MLEHLPRPHLLPGPLSKSSPRLPEGVATTVGGLSRTFHHQWLFWVKQKESWSFARLCCVYLISAGAQPLRYLHRFISSRCDTAGQSLPADARGDIAASVQHPCPYHALCAVGSEISISGRRWEAAEVLQALLV